MERGTCVQREDERCRDRGSAFFPFYIYSFDIDFDRMESLMSTSDTICVGSIA